MLLTLPALAAEPPDFWGAVDAALTAHKSGNYQQAVAHFDRAFRLAPDGADIATLRFNAAASLFELGRYKDAERRFLEAADDKRLRAFALLNAGFSAVRDARSEDAEKHLRASRRAGSKSDQELKDLDRRLSVLIEEAKQSKARLQFEGVLSRASAQIERKQPAQALVLLQRTDVSGKSSEDVFRWRELVIAAAFSAQQWTVAQNHLDVALRKHPEDSSLHLVRADTSFATRDYDDAEASYRKALSLGLPSADQQYVERRLEQLRPLPSSGLNAWGTVSAGYDSNAQQTAAELTFDTQTGEDVRAELGSLLATLGAEVGYVQRFGSAFAVTPYFSTTFYGLFADEARPFSILLPELGSRFEWALSPQLGVELSLAGSAAFQGLVDVGLFTYEAAIGAQISYRANARRLFRARVEVRPTVGAGDMDYLTGARVFGLLQQRWRFGWGRLTAQLGARSYFAGVQTVISFDDNACVDGCDVAAPLSFVAPRAGIAGTWALHPRIRISGTVNYEYRRYLEEGGTSIVPISRFERVDGRLSAGLRLDFPVDDKGALNAFCRYDFLLSRSNVAFDPNDPARQLHYGNYNYEQQTIELGLEALF